MAGQIPSHAVGKGLGYLHELPDQLGILERLTKWARHVGRPEDVAGDLAAAFQALASGRPRPVGVEIPLDVLARKAAIVGVAPLPPLAPTPLDEEAVGKAAALLARAKRPQIFVGAGAQDAALEVRAIAEALGAPVVSHRMGKGVIDDRHDLAQNLTAGHEFWRTCDVVLAVGCRLHLPLIAWGTDAAMAIVKIDVDPLEMTKGQAPDVAIVGDAGQVLAALAQHLPERVADADARLARSRDVKARRRSQALGAGAATLLSPRDPRRAAG